MVGPCAMRSRWARISAAASPAECGGMAIVSRSHHEMFNSENTGENYMESYLRMRLAFRPATRSSSNYVPVQPKYSRVVDSKVSG